MPLSLMAPQGGRRIYIYILKGFALCRRPPESDWLLADFSDDGAGAHRSYSPMTVEASPMTVEASPMVVEASQRAVEAS